MFNINITDLNEYLIEFTKNIHFMHGVRHTAANRLDTHKMLSKWTLSLLAIAVIILTLQAQSDIKFRFVDGYVNIIQVVFSVMTLTYSLLIGMSDYSAKSIKMYYCALSLGELQRKAQLLIIHSKKKPNKNEILSLVDEYNYNLSRCENHTQFDYINSTKPKPDILNKSKYYAKISIYYLLAFGHYYLSIIFVYGWIIIHSIPKG